MFDPNELFDFFEAGTALAGDFVGGVPGQAIKTTGLLARLIHDGLQQGHAPDALVEMVRQGMVAAAYERARKDLGP